MVDVHLCSVQFTCSTQQFFCSAANLNILMNSLVEAFELESITYWTGRAAVSYSSIWIYYSRSCRTGLIHISWTCAIARVDVTVPTCILWGVVFGLNFPSIPSLFMQSPLIWHSFCSPWCSCLHQRSCLQSRASRPVDVHVCPVFCQVSSVALECAPFLSIIAEPPL